MKGDKKESKKQKAVKFDEWEYLRVKDDDIRSIEYWNIDSVTPVLLAPRFRAFVEGIEGVGGTPSTYYDIDDEGNFIKNAPTMPIADSLEQPDSDDALNAAWEGWHKVLKKIQYAFDTLEACSYGIHGSVTDMLSEEQLKKVEDGLLLFAKNYFSLWY